MQSGDTLDGLSKHFSAERDYSSWLPVICVTAFPTPTKMSLVSTFQPLGSPNSI